MLRAPVKRRSRDLLIGVSAAAAAGALCRLGFDLSEQASVTAAITTLCAVWWVLEPIPIPATSLIPFAAFPLTGVLSHKTVATAYGHHIILLLMGGFMLSVAIEKSGVHRRMALGMVRVTGGAGRRLVLGFMLASWACSMWISNTATTLMLLPVVLAVVRGQDDPGLAVPLLLGVAYGASIGGVATPIGTPPNVIFMSIYEKHTGIEVSFLDWMRIGVPAAIVLLPIAWLWLTRGLRAGEPAVIERPGAWSAAERRVLAVFVITALAWIFRGAPMGGWSAWFGVTEAGDSTVALAAVIALFIIPDGDGGQLLDWPTAAKIPWGLLLLFGGGIAISLGFKASGLSEAMGQGLGQLADWPLVVMIGIICLSVTFLTEVTSNTASTTLLMPVLASAATAAAVDPRLLMVPAALSASCAFMLPVATAPNAIVHGTGYVSTSRMAREGIVLNVVIAAALTAICTLLL